MKKLLIIDTQGEAISEEYQALLPGAKLRGIEMETTRGTSCHEHGALCGWLSAIPLIGAGFEFEIVFVRVFDKDAVWIPNCESWMLDVIREEKPNYVSRSWGAADADSQLSEMYAQLSFSEWAAAYRALVAELGIVDFGAAGNSDENDADVDVDFPQRDLADVVNVIGACDRSGVPTKWSGDGAGVQCVMWADLVYSPDMTGKWVLWSGTSAATPKACGACAALGYTREQWLTKLKNLPAGCRPAGDWTLPHPKWGYGCAEDLWQNFARRVPAGLLPPATPKATKEVEIIKPEFFDYRRVNGHEEARGIDRADNGAGSVPAAPASRRRKSVDRSGKA